jgi:hypothetical protein
MKFPLQLRRRHGYQQIVSDAQAYQLLRREVKQMRANSQRRAENRCNAVKLLQIKKGAWFQLVRCLCLKKKHSILILAEETDE